MQNEIEREISERLGVAQKCTFCSDRIDFGIANGLTPGSDPRATPACVNACIADALQFGDLDDANSNVSRLLREHKSFRMHAELGTEPGFHYLYDKAAAAPAADTKPALSDGQAGRMRTRGVEPWHQKHWDWKAAGNFLCGGAGAGLVRRRHHRQLCRNSGIAAGARRAGDHRLRSGAFDIQDRPAVAFHLCAAPAATLLDVARSLGRRRCCFRSRS